MKKTIKVVVPLDDPYLASTGQRVDTLVAITAWPVGKKQRRMNKQEWFPITKRRGTSDYIQDATFDGWVWRFAARLQRWTGGCRLTAFQRLLQLFPDDEFLINEAIEKELWLRMSTL